MQRHSEGGLPPLSNHIRQDHEDNAAKTLLMKVAIALFAEKGYAGTSVREIVERAGVTKPTLYYYFGNKEGIFREILEEAYTKLEVLLADLLKSRGSFLDRMVSFSRQFYEHVMRQQDLNRMVHNLLFGPPKGVPVFDFDRFHERIISYIRAIYEEGLAKNEVEQFDPEEVAFIVLGLSSICFNSDSLHPDIADPERPVRLLMMAFNGLKKA